MDSSQFNCRMYEEKYPEVDQIVMVKVTQIAEMGAYVSLLEYNNIEGMILLSELSRKRIRSINKLIKVGRKEVVTVLRVDKEKGKFFFCILLYIPFLNIFYLGYIDLSKRRVGSEDVAAMEEKFAKSKAVHSIMKHVAKSENINVEKLYEQFGWPLYKKYEHAYNAFKLALQDPDGIFGDLVPPGELRDKLLATIKHRLTRKPVKIRADIEISCFEYSGIDAIKEALIAGKQCSTDPETPIIIHLVASPLYVIYVTSLDKAQGIELVQTAIKTIKEKIESSGGTLEVKVEPRAVTDSDDFTVDATTVVKGEQNESDSDSDEDDD